MNQKRKAGTDRRETRPSSLVSRLTAGMAPEIAALHVMDYEAVRSQPGMGMGAFVYRFDKGALREKVTLHRLHAAIASAVTCHNQLSFLPPPAEGQLVVTPVFNFEMLAMKADIVLVPMQQFNRVADNSPTTKFEFYMSYLFSGVRRWVKLGYNQNITGPWPARMADWAQELETIYRTYDRQIHGFPPR